MNQQIFLDRLARIIEDSKAGILATTDEEGRPHMRWMTPWLLPGREGALFSVTPPHFAKVAQLEKQPTVEWMIQTPSLDQVINIKGKVNFLDNPSIKMEVMEGLGSRLFVFWKANTGFSDFIVLETVMEEACYYLPMKGTKEKIIFGDRGE
ncbi:MAG: pyridoxamine 5'-phosphate oxidase family protein [Clostridia bacterium]|jgi:general stress protein 26